MKKSILLSLAAVLGLPSFLFSITDATWIGGDWNNNGSWTYNMSPNVFPNGIDTTARFVSGGGVGLGQDITIGHIIHTGGTVNAGGGLESFIFSVSSEQATWTGNGSGEFFISTERPITLSSPLTISSGGSNFAFGGFFVGSEDLTVTNGFFEYQVSVGAVPFVPFTGNLNVESTGDIFLSSGFGGANPVFGGITGTGLIQLGNNVTINSVSPSTFSGTISGSGLELIKQGSATFTMNSVGGSLTQLSIREGAVSAASLANLVNTDFILISQSGPGISATLHITGSSPFTYPGGVSLSTGAVLNIDPTTALTLSGSIFGSAGPVQKTGGGELIISGAPSVTSPTTVLEGTLTVSGTVAIPMTVSGGIYSVTGSTSGTTAVNSGGAFNLSGSTSGVATVNSGGIYTITGTASAGTTVNSGGLLKGTGTLQNATVNAGGTIRPGSSIGTLNVSGDLSLIGIAQIEISPSAASLIHVTGVTSLLGGTVDVIQQAGSYPSSGSYPIIVSDGGLLGFMNPTVTGGLAGFSFSLDYSTPDTLTLVYQLTGAPIPTTGLTGQADRFARYLNQNVPISPATQLLFAVPANQLQDALDSASPSRNAFAPFAVQNTMFSLSDLVSGHLVDQRFYHAQKRSNPNVAGLMDEAASFTADASGRMMFSRGCETQSVWIGVIGEFAHQAALDQNPAFNFWSGGSMIGWDFYSDRNLFGLGGGAAYTYLIQDENGGNAKINYYFASLYDTFYGPCDFPLYAELALWGVYNQIHNYRNISFPGFEGTASATFSSWELVPHFGIGYHANYCCFSLEPFAQFDLVVDWQEGFQEHGAGDFDMNHVSRNSQFLRSEGGLRLYKIKQTDWGAWWGVIKGSFVNKKTFGTGSVSASIVGTNALFSVETFRNTQNLGAAGFEMLWRWGQRKPVTLSLAYNGEFGSQFWSQEGMIRLMKDF